MEVEREEEFLTNKLVKKLDQIKSVKQTRCPPHKT